MEDRLDSFDLFHVVHMFGADLTLVALCTSRLRGVNEREGLIYWQHNNECAYVGSK